MATEHLRAAANHDAPVSKKQPTAEPVLVKAEEPKPEPQGHGATVIDPRKKHGKDKRKKHGG